MKKKILLVFLFCMLILSITIYATDNGYEFNLKYQGEIVEGEEVSASVTLTGTDATPYSNVRINVDLTSAPAKPTLFAYDSAGTKFDIADIGYWGPEEGFAVGGTFTNETPITATFPKAGTYVIKLSLVDVKNSDAVITTKDFTITVNEENKTEDNTVQNNTTVNNNLIGNNTINNIPQDGISYWSYILIIILFAIAIWAVIYFIKNKKR